MAETLYWITRLDGIYTFSSIITVISAFVSVLSCVAFTCAKIHGDDEIAYTGVKILKLSTLTLAISSLIVIFVPTTKEALLIYGVGNTVDYIKSNEKALQLPDKCIDALDAWVKSLNDNGKKSNRYENN